MRPARQGLSGVPDPLAGRVHRDPSGADAAAADPCQRRPDQRSGAGAGQVVQPASRLRLPDLRRGDSGYFRPYGNPAPLRDDRTAPRPVRAGPVRTRLQGHDGGRNSAGNRLTGTVLALIAPPFQRASETETDRLASKNPRTLRIPQKPALGLDPGADTGFANGIRATYWLEACSSANRIPSSRKMLRRGLVFATILG